MYTAWLFTDDNLTEVEQVFFLKQSIKFQGKMRKIASRNTLKKFLEYSGREEKSDTLTAFKYYS